MLLLFALLGALICPWGFVSAAPDGYKTVHKRSDDTTIEAVVANLSNQVSEFNAKIVALEAKLSKAQTHVAFHAHYSSDHVQLGQHAHVIFDVARTNLGGGYDVNTGFFRTPVSGTYMLVVNFMSEYNKQLYVNMYIDNILEDYGISHSGNAWDDSSLSMVVHLNAGQTVHLENGQNLSNSIRGGHWSTFSGFLIQADP